MRSTRLGSAAWVAGAWAPGFCLDNLPAARYKWAIQSNTSCSFEMEATMSGESTAPLQPPGASFPPAWRTVSFGTVCLSMGAILFVVGLFGLSVLVVLNAQLFHAPRVEGMENRDRMLPVFFLAAGFIVLLGGAMLVSASLCLFCVAPAESGTRPIAGGALACWLLFLIITLQIPLAPMVGIPLRSRIAEQGFRQGVDPQPIQFVNVFGFSLAGAMFAVASGSLTMAYVCGVAHCFKNERLARSARTLLAYQIVALPICALAGFIHAFIAENWKGLNWYWAEAPCLVVILVIIGIGFTWLFRVLAEMRRMLRTAEEIASEQTPG